ncbi:MAG: hypothetical protein ACXW2F_09485 [Thermoanaerobaculia bacterium]
MRRVGLLFALSLLLPSLHAANVEITRPHIVFLSDAGVGVACKSPGRRGCTILQTEFSCTCKQSGDKWTLEPRLIATPYIYTTTQGIMRHELEHIADVRSSLNEYAGSLLLRSFESREACASFVGEESRLFSSTMRNIQRITVLRRDGVQYAAAAGDH